MRVHSICLCVMCMRYACMCVNHWLIGSTEKLKHLFDKTQPCLRNTFEFIFSPHIFVNNEMLISFSNLFATIRIKFNSIQLKYKMFVVCCWYLFTNVLISNESICIWTDPMKFTIGYWLSLCEFCLPVSKLSSLHSFYLIANYTLTFCGTDWV